MEAFSERFNKALNARHMTAAELSRRSGIDEGTISNYRKGRYVPKQVKLEIVAKALDVNIAWLMGAEMPMLRFGESYKPSVILSEEIDIPEIATVSAGFDKMPLSNFEYDRFSIPRSYLCGHDPQDCFIIRVKGDSMYPLYVDGDRVLARRSDALDYSGQIGLVQDGETATIKKVEFGNGWIRLVPINPVYAPRMIRGQDLEQVRIIGIPMVMVRQLKEE